MSREPGPMTDGERLAAGRLRDAALVFCLSARRDHWDAAIARMRELVCELALVPDDQVVALRVAVERAIGLVPDAVHPSSSEARLREVLADVVALRAGLVVP